MEFQLEDMPEQPVVGIRFTTSIERIAADIGSNYEALFGFLGRKQVAPAGPPMALYYDLVMDERNIDMETCVPVASVVEGDGEVTFHVLAGGRHATAMHMGPYDEMGSTYEAMRQWISGEGLSPRPPVREIYLNDPCQVADPRELMTRVLWPVE
jgi:effector-binding domain-containing protein